MIKIKKIIFFIIKSTLGLVALLTLTLFFYAALFYEPPLVERKSAENQITKSEESSDFDKEQKLKGEGNHQLKESSVKEKISGSETEQTSDTTQDKNKIEQPEISDSLFMIIGNKPITKSDIVNEIKIILILNNESYSKEKRDQLQEIAIKTIIKRNIKQIELDRNNYFKFNEKDLEKELIRLASDINLDLETLKNVFSSNELNFSLVEDQIKLELFWNSLIFELYKNRITVNPEEIERKLELIQSGKKIYEYLISEIMVRVVDKDKLEYEIKELLNKIKNEGFKNVAKILSITESAKKGGDLGWLNENIIAEKIKPAIVDTPVGNLSEPIVLPEGILIFKIRNKRKMQTNINLEQQKNQLVNDEKTKMLRRYALSHYDTLRRSVTVKFFND